MGGIRTYNISTSGSSALFDVDFGGHIRKIDPAIIRSRGYADNHGTRVDINYNNDRGIYEAKIDGEFPNYRPLFSTKSDVFEYIQKKHSEGVGLQKIADYLNKKDVATASGRGRWHGSSVGRILKKGGFRTGTLYDSGYPSNIFRIHALKDQGYSDRAIAKLFNFEGVKTLSGRGNWHGSSIGRLLKKHPLSEKKQTQTQKVRSLMQSINSEQELNDRVTELRDQAERLKNPDKVYMDEIRNQARQHRSESPPPVQDVQARIDFLREQSRKLLGK